jgi:hypothetical protein
MVANRRRGEPAIPHNHEELLTSDQKDGLRKLESFGWILKFLRRPQFEPREVVLVYSDEKSYAVLNEDGSLDQEGKVDIRKSDRDEQFLAEGEAPVEAPAKDPWQESAGESALDYLEERPAEIPAETTTTPGKEPVPAKSGDGKPPKYLV